MAVKILWADLRYRKTILQSATIEWRSGLTAAEVVVQGFGESDAQQIARDLQSNNPEIMVSWYNLITDEGSGIGGVGSLDWEIQDRTILAINYEDEMTTDKQVERCADWMLESEASRSDDYVV
jgi:hypothetical protein